MEITIKKRVKEIEEKSVRASSWKLDSNLNEDKRLSLFTRSLEEIINRKWNTSPALSLLVQTIKNGLIEC